MDLKDYQKDYQMLLTVSSWSILRNIGARYALQVIDMAGVLQPARSEWLIIKGLYYLMDGKCDKAAEVLDAALVVSPEAEDASVLKMFSLLVGWAHKRAQGNIKRDIGDELYTRLIPYTLSNDENVVKLADLAISYYENSIANFND